MSSLVREFDALALCLCFGSLEFGLCFLLDSLGTFARGDRSVHSRLFRISFAAAGVEVPPNSHWLVPCRQA